MIKVYRRFQLGVYARRTIRINREGLSAIDSGFRCKMEYVQFTYEENNELRNQTDCYYSDPLKPNWSSYLGCKAHSQCRLSHISFCSCNAYNNHHHLSIWKQLLRWAHSRSLKMDFESWKPFLALQQSYYPAYIEIHIECLPKRQCPEQESPKCLIAAVHWH